MKQIYLVNKSKAVLGLFSGVKSRITLTQPLFKHYCVLTVALMLLLGGFSTRVWGGTWYAQINAYSDPSTGGYVYVGTNSSCTADNATATSDWGSNSGSKKYHFSGDINLWLCAKVINTNYVFKGWNTDQSNTVISGSSSVPYKATVWGDSKNFWGNIKDECKYDYYAIFARLTANKSSINTFESVNVGSTSNAQEVKITYVHAGKVTAVLTGDFSFEPGSSSQSKTLANDNTNTQVNDQTINIYFKPTCNSTRNGTLTIKGSNGMADVVISLSGTGVLNDQTLSWNNESSIATDMMNGATQNISATASSGLTVSYESSNTTILSVDANGKLTANAVGGPVTITAKQEGNCTYGEAVSITKTFNVKPKDTPIFTPNGFSEGTTKALKVDDEVTMDVAYVSDGLSGDFTASATKVNNQDVLQITRNGNTITIKALREGTSTATFTQTENSTIFGATKSYTFNVTKVDNTLSPKNKSYERYVDEDDDLTSFATKNSNGTIHASSTDDKIAYYDITNNKLVIDNNGNKSFNSTTVTIKIWQDATVKYAGITEANAKTVTLTVKKYEPTFNDQTTYTKLVGETQTANYVYSNVSPTTPTANSTDNFYYTIDNVSFTKQSLNNGGNLITYNPGTKVITACNAGSCDITFHQKETYKYQAKTKSYHVVVNKRANALSCKFDNVTSTTWSKTLNFNQETNVVFSANNTDVPIVVTQKTGNTIATYHSAPQNTIRASYSVGQATWSVSQAENYKYLAPETKTVTVNVGTVPLECYVLDEPAEHSMGKYGDSTFPKAGKASYTYSWTEEGAVLKFKMWKFSNANDIGNYVTLYDGAGAKIGNDYNYSIGSMSTSPTEYTITLPAGVRSVKFRNGTGAWEGASTLNTYISNVKVTRSTWLNLQDKEGEEITSLEMPALLINNASTTADFYINYNTCADEIKVVSNHPHITVSESSFESGTSGTKKITVTYSSTALENINATITVYTPSENKTLTIHAQTVKQPQTIIWSAGYEGASVSLPVGLTEADPATASSGLDPVLYSTNAPSVIQIADDGQSFSIIGEGTATLTASQAGDEGLWDPVTSSKTINATDKKIQVIHWEQDFTRSIAPGDVKSLLAEVYINNPLAGVQTKDDARTALIQYSCPTGNDVISVAGNQMTVLGYGTTSVTATIEGDEDYEEASVTLLVRVREPSAGCETPFVLDHTEQVQLFSMDIEWGEWTTPQITSEPILIDKSKGKPDKLSFMHEGEEYAIPVFSNIKVYRGPIKVQERVNGAWSDVEGSQVTPTKYEWNQLSNLQLNENADAIRFVRLVGGQGYHNIKNIQISLLQYLREEEETINLGNIQAGAVWPSAIGFDYSDVKHDLLVSKSGADGSFLQMDETIEMDCGSHDHYDFPITFAPTHIGDWTNDVTITDPITSKSITVHLTAHVIQGSQSIVWNVAKTTYAVTEPMNVLTATATSGLPVSYTITAGNDVASIVGDEVIISKPGTFTIQASQAGDVNFKAAEPVSKTFTIAVSEYVFTNHDGNSDWNTTGNWLAGTKPGSNEDVIIRGNLIINNNVEVHSLTIEEGFEVALTVGGQLTVGDGASQYREHYGDLHVEKEGHVFLNNGELKVNKFILDATLNDIVNGQEAKSGQVTNPTRLDIIETAYFDLEMDPDGQVTFGWYDFTVPFDVNISNGIFRLNNDGSTTPLVSGRDFIVTYYDEARRAAGQKGWVQMNGSAQLTAGVAYSITLDDEVTQNTIRFVWNKQHSIGASYTTPVTRSNNGTTTNRGWNGIGNGTLTHTQLQGLPANTKVQMYDHSTKSFRAVDAADYTYAVGTAFFYQAPENPSPVVQTKADGTLLLPLRAPQYENRTVNEFRLTLTEESTAREVDVLYVSASEEATGEYTVGHDLLKMASANEVSIAQIWATNGKLQLCDIEMPLINNNAICDLGLNAPKEGAYILEIQRAPEDAMLYLTYEGRAIWNLSYSPYVFDLTKGMTEGYGLKLYANPAPQVATGVDEMDAEAQSMRKVMIDNVLYIITPDGAMYDVTGKSVK